MRFCTPLLLALALAAGLAPGRVHAQDPRPAVDYRPGAVLVGLRPGASAASVGQLDAAGYEITDAIPGLDAVSVAVPVGQEAETAHRLAQVPGVAYAELDYRASVQGNWHGIPNDPDFVKQWSLPLVGAPAAWDVTTGSLSVVIAVLDTGIDLEHPDLKGRVWTNPGEIPGNGKDDDDNGMIDDTRGWRFYHAYNGSGFEARGDGQVADDNGHGTHTAGIAGARTNNGIGVAGLTWDSPVMAVKVLDKSGYAWYSDVAAGILYAANNGAAVLNLSLGGSEPSETLCAAVKSAVDRGKVVVAAAGNSGESVYYPAACDGALAVGATDQFDAPASFTNRGPCIDLAAPGVDIYSTWYASGLNLSTYAAVSGTSEAAPHVAGAAALVLARWPSLSAQGVKQQLQSALVDVGEPGRDDATGWGRLDLGVAVASLAQPVDLRLSAATVPAVVVAGNPMTTTFTVVNAGASAATSVTLFASLPAEPVVQDVRSATATCSLAGAEMRCGMARLEPGERATVTAVLTPVVVGTGVLATAASVGAAQLESTPADNRQTLTTGIVPVLRGRIYLDGNGDGIRQSWETRGIGDAWVLLEQAGQPVAYTASEPPTGAFRFDTLPAGTYDLIADLPPGYLFTTPAQVEMAVAADREQVVYFGAWTGTAEPVPGRLHLPLILLGQ